MEYEYSGWGLLCLSYSEVDLAVLELTRCSAHAVSRLTAIPLDERLTGVHSIAGVPFPKNFMSVAKTILKRLFRVYAHIYHQHFDSVMQLQEEAHLNTSFKHFIFFVQVGEPY